MALETAKDSIMISQIIGQKKEIITIEGDVIVNDVKPDVLKIINTNGTICIYKKEVLDGKVKIEGCINTYIVYLADDENGSVRSLCTSLDFTEYLEIEGCQSQMNLEEQLVIKGFETKILNGRKIHVKAFVDINAKVYSDDTFEIISNIENNDDMQILNNTEKIISLIGSGNGKTFAKDTISIPETDDVAEIMRINFNIVDEEIKVSYNKVLIKANAKVSIMYLTEENAINTVEGIIPIMGFIDLQNINENSICKVKSTLRNLIIKPDSNNEHSIYIDAEIELTCTAYEEKEINVIEDLYSLTDDIEFTHNSIMAMTNKWEIKEDYNVKEQITIPELVNGKILSLNIAPYIINTQVKNNKLIYEGNLEIEFIYEYNNSVETNLIKIPFNFELLSDKVNELSLIETIPQIKNLDIQSSEGKNITIDIDIEFNIEIENNREIKVISNINKEKATEQDRYSMVIYFVKPGDTLWKIAKQFKSKVSDIVRINGIEDENKISVGTQLYIPKFMKRNIPA